MLSNTLTINNQPLFRPSIWDYKQVRRLRSAMVRGRQFQFSADVERKEYLNLGCGPNTNNPHMANLDYNWYRGVDVCWDITTPLPWKDASLKGIYTEHCLEHITFDGCAYALREARRVMKPGGTIRVAVPDGQLYIELYQKARAGQKVEFPYQSADEVTPMICVNRIFNEFTHIFIYDAETMGMMLERAGFVDVRRATFMQGRDAKLLLDTEARAVESLYIEASAPA